METSIDAWWAGEVGVVDEVTSASERTDDNLLRVLDIFDRHPNRESIAGVRRVAIEAELAKRGLRP